MDSANAPVAKEFRFSVVMYGGVSLAIYMNGVAQELLHMVRSTARKAHNEDEFRFAVPGNPQAPNGDSLRSTEMVYRKLARQLNDAGLDDVRFIVDVISGTSAGGINGIFLAKALTDDTLKFDVLQNLWIQEGALEKLLNDKQTTSATGLPLQEPQRSLLCSDRMYIKLLDALRQMKTSGTPGDPLCTEIDLFVTTTDITGRVVPLRLADMLVWERKYKTDFHFRYKHRQRPDSIGIVHNPDLQDQKQKQEQDHNDLQTGNDPFIAFVARCTSSFPFAFEPMQLSKIQELQNTKAWPGVDKPKEEDLKKWESKFFESEQDEVGTGSNRTRAFGDGGYLNNKPFSFVVDTLGRHSSSYPTERKLIYVEPTPDHPEQDAGQDRAAAERKANAPNALVNSYDALIKLPGAQPIHDDLQRVIERNRLVRKVTELSAVITSTIQYRTAESHERVETDPAASSVGDFSYLVLRMYSTTDELASVLSEWFQFPKSSSFYYAIRCLVRAWRETDYEAKVQPPPRRENLVKIYRTFLQHFDIEYEKRKYRFIRQQINLFYCYDAPAKERLMRGFQVAEADLANNAFGKAFQQTLGDLKKPFDNASRIIGDAQRQIRPGFTPNASDKLAGHLINSFGKLAQASQNYQQATSRTIVEYVLGIEPHDANRKYASVRAGEDEDYNGRAKEILKKNKDLSEAVQETAAAISQVLQRGTLQAGEAAALGVPATRDALAKAALPEAAKRGALQAIAVVEFFTKYFDQFDTGLFPLLYDTDVGTPEPIGIIRVSPEDATHLYDQSKPCSTQKLAGASLAHFGAFLDRSFRTNDILWGRLDGAERIIRALLSTDKQKKVADELIDEAHKRIVEDFLRDRQQELAGVIFQVAKALESQPEPTGTLGKKWQAFRARRAKKRPAQDCSEIHQDLPDARVLAIRECVTNTLATLPNQMFAEAVDGFLTPPKILEYLRKEPPPRDPDHRTTLESTTRTIRIIGGMLDGLGKQTESAGSFLIRLGSMLWWLVEAAVPHGLGGHFFRWIFALLLWFEIVMVVGGTFFSPEMQTLGLKLLGITVVLWLIKDGFQRFILQGKRGPRVTFVMAGIAIAAAVAIWLAQHIWGHVVPLCVTQRWIHEGWDWLRGMF